MKKIILTMFLASSTLVFAKTGEPIIKDDSFLRTEKTIKDDKEKKQHQIQIKSFTKKASDLEMCVAIAIMIPINPTGVFHCFNTYGGF
ncbi:MAG: hypothetical protein KA796_14160 [Chryseobacterium sp.]|nr:hypothetical protein [Chryseobacterium sp.]MBP7500985.1 hypothetical protein [Chryseobacterium sp.]